MRLCLLHYDPLVLTYVQASDWVNAEIDRVKSAASRKPRRIEVPVRYGGESGPDLEFVASYHNLSVQEVLRMHTGRELHRLYDGLYTGFCIYGEIG